MPGIIVGVDGSSHSRKALGRAITEAVAHHAPLTVLVVHQAVVDVYGLPSQYSDDAAMTEKAREAAQTEVEQMLAAAATRPESVTVKAVHGLPVDELVNASSDADMLVLGRHGGGDFARLVRGSTATQVANHAHCAVLIIPPAEDA